MLVERVLNVEVLKQFHNLDNAYPIYEVYNHNLDIPDSLIHCRTIFIIYDNSIFSGQKIVDSVIFKKILMEITPG